MLNIQPTTGDGDVDMGMLIQLTAVSVQGAAVMADAHGGTGLSGELQQ